MSVRDRSEFRVPKPRVRLPAGCDTGALGRAPKAYATRVANVGRSRGLRNGVSQGS